MRRPKTLAFDIRWLGITVWHVDPETDGTDDSCGWFLRPRHLNQEKLERIVRKFEFDWDRQFEKYDVGLFRKDGQPRFSVPGVVLNLFYKAAGIVFESDGRTNWKKARRYIRKHLLEILLFSENTTDSLFESCTRMFEIGCDEEYTKEKRDERLCSFARIIYAYIARDIRSWYKHPRWHIHHWRVQITAIQRLKRWLFSRCARCGKRFRWGESPTSNSWHGTGPLWFRSESGVFHGSCYAAAAEVQAGEER